MTTQKHIYVKNATSSQGCFWKKKRLPALEPCLLIVMASVQCLLSGAPGRTPQSTPCQLGVWHPRGVYGDALVLVVDAIGRGALPITLDTSPHDAAGRARQGGRAPRREGRAGARWAGGWCWGRSVRQGEARGGGGGGGRKRGSTRALTWVCEACRESDGAREGGARRRKPLSPCAITGETEEPRERMIVTRALREKNLV